MNVYGGAKMITVRDLKEWLKEWKADDVAVVKVNFCDVDGIEMTNEGNVSIDIDLENSELCADFIETTHDLKGDVDDLESRNAELEERLDDCEEKCYRFQLDKEDADRKHESAVKELEDRLQDLNDELQATKDELSACRIELQYAEGENENLRKQVLDLESRNVY